MTRRFADIDLSRLVKMPLGLETFDAVYLARMGEISDRLNAAGIPYDVTNLATDTYALTERAGAYREILNFAARDDAVRSVMLATARGAFLDHLGATQVPPVERLTIAPAIGTTPAMMEDDEAYRLRIQLAPEALSTCGPEGAYLFFALAVDGVKAASPYGPMSFGGLYGNPFTPLGCVNVPIVASLGDGTASPALVAAVQAELSAKARRPLADWVTVSAAAIETYTIEATLKVGPGADRSLVKELAEERLLAQALRQHRPGAAQLRQMLYGAAYAPDETGAIVVEEVVLSQPAADVNAVPITPATPGAAYRAPFCLSISVEVVSDDD